MGLTWNASYWKILLEAHLMSNTKPKGFEEPKSPYIQKALDDGQTTCGIFIDLEKAWYSSMSWHSTRKTGSLWY